jgi:retron-type reverse transcriptase
MGYVTPIPKKDAELNFDDVRSITLTPLLSKMYESFVANWLKAEVEPLLDPHQYGNRKNTSNSHYLVSLLHFIFKHVDEPGKWLNLIIIDFKKGFDLIGHNILISKLLIVFKVNPAVVKIIQSFSIYRFQILKYMKSFSEPEPDIVVYLKVPFWVLFFFSYDE